MKRLFAAIWLLLLAALAGAQEAPVKFAFLTDLHYAQGAPAGKYLQYCVEHINSQHDLEFALVGGDLTDFGTDEEIAEVKVILDGLKVPYYVVAGNHDAKWSESGCNTFLKVFGYEHFEFEAGGWRFLGCNCGPDMRMAPALLPKESMTWLENLEGGRKSIFVNHYPQDTSVLNYFDVTRALKKAGVQFEIGGHWHKNTILDYDGIPAVLCRSTLPTKGMCGYTIFTLGDSHVAAQEVAISATDGNARKLGVWYEADLKPVEDRTAYDEHGMAESYPWMRYDINDKYTQARELWRIEDDSNICAGFAVRGRVAYYTTTSGCLRAISLKDGRRIWSRQFPGKIFSTPAVEAGRVVFGCSDGNIYAVCALTGKTLWKKEARKSVLGSPVIRNGIVYIGASDGCFRALNLKDGTPRWTFSDVDGFVESTPMVDDAQVVFGTWAGKLYSLDPATGRQQWVWTSGKSSRMYSPAATVPVKSNWRIFVALPDRRVYAIDSATGKQLFWVSGGRESVGLSSDGRTVYAKTMYHHTYAFPAAAFTNQLSAEGELPQSALDWNVENVTGYEISPTPIVEHGGVVYVPTDKGNLVAHSAEDGSLLWAHKISIGLINPMRVWSSREGTFVLASTMDGVVTLLKVEK